MPTVNSNISYEREEAVLESNPSGTDIFVPESKQAKIIDMLTVTKKQALLDGALMYDYLMTNQ
ncbi:MAG: hypothetical protein KBT36_10630 [Kurthia sp.]|nr:hypothetical protein [Candidatus Kurthia equi]